MKKATILLAMVFAPISSAHSTGSSQSSSGARYEICFVDGQYKMLQPTMCYALGGRRGG